MLHFVKKTLSGNALVSVKMSCVTNTHSDATGRMREPDGLRRSVQSTSSISLRSSENNLFQFGLWKFSRRREKAPHHVGKQISLKVSLLSRFQKGVGCLRIKPSIFCFVIGYRDEMGLCWNEHGGEENGSSFGRSVSFL